MQSKVKDKSAQTKSVSSAAAHMSRRPHIQTKLSVGIGKANDKYEAEADQMADKIVSDAPAIQRKCAACAQEDKVQKKPALQKQEDDELQTKLFGGVQRKEIKNQPDFIQKMQTDEDQVQAKQEGGGESTASSWVSQKVSETKGGGQPLSKSTQSFMETGFGRDFSSVRVHTDSTAVQMNKELGAQAFTHGNNVYFNEGKYNPESQSGKHLLAHELTHTVQQRSAPRLIQRKCDIDEAGDWYNTSKMGKKITWTRGLVDELFKVTANRTSYANALAEGAIGPNFVRLVCEAQAKLGFKGDDVDGKIGDKTIAAWEKWKTGGEHGIDYTRLFEDKKLEIGLAIGQDFHGSEFVAMEALLVGRKFTIANDTATHKTYTKNKKFKVQGDNTAPKVEIQIIIDLISAKSDNPKETFKDFLTDREITIYSGHARYGTGPDFDPKDKLAENFVIGVNSALHKEGKLKSGYKAEFNKKLKGMANDLEKLSKAGEFDMDTYQVWFLNACSTAHYLDEIRGGLVADKKGNKKAKKDLRVMGTSHSIYSDAIPILEGILDMNTMEEIIAAMDAYEKKDVKGRGEKPKKEYYFAD